MQAHPQEFAGSNDHPQALIIKGKRTKRQRPSSPLAVTVTSSSSSASTGGAGGGGAEEYNSISSPTTSDEIYESTEEEEDMANCLIMLAQSEGPKSRIDQGKFKAERIGSRKLSEITSTTPTNKAGFFVYECKTCNRSFASFQALGGHRASHKKPKGGAAPIGMAHAEDGHHVDQEPLLESPVLALQVSNSKACQGNKSNKIHECSICGSEFSSGQALGGHMRRHRAAAAAVDIKPRDILSLDLNLPAPEDDLRESKLQLGAPKQAIVFSTPALVDCHY
ncbi:hypothetical protein V6N13_113912 [Hibiscus sabdariffa]|uniref:C2H2-type domain-containing protein n=1 Tax=Hibiscus sabdariffa TaxID=183260 RepID=A0ABR2U0H9_9ROSI